MSRVYKIEGGKKTRVMISDCAYETRHGVNEFRVTINYITAILTTV